MLSRLNTWIGRDGGRLSEIDGLRRDRDGYKRSYETLQSEVGALRRDCEGYIRKVAEMDVLMAELRDDRDRHKVAWESAAAELRRPSRVKSLGAETNALPDPGSPPTLERQERRESSLRLLCVGTGRDGTTSLSRLFQDVFDRQGSQEVAVHEWASRELNMHFCDFKETNDRHFEDRMRELFRYCPYACAVGNGYAAALPIVAEILGDQITLVHLRRRDRAACIASLVQNAEVSPQNHLYYSESPAATGKRLAAFHFGELSRAQWDDLTMPEKFGWYYDKTHFLIEEHKHLFKKTFSVDTENLSEVSVRQLIARTAGSEEMPAAFHVNRFVDLRSVPPQRHSWVQRLLGELNVQQLAHDDLYGVRQVLNEFVYQMSHFPDQAPGALEELRWTLSEGHKVLGDRMKDLRELMERIERA